MKSIYMLSGDLCTNYISNNVDPQQGEQTKENISLSRREQRTMEE